MSKEIHKKAWPEYFEQVLNGSKTFDVRLADWECEPGDILVLDEFDAATRLPTGRSIRKKVGYIVKTKGLDLFSENDIETYGFQILSLLPEHQL